MMITNDEGGEGVVGNDGARKEVVGRKGGGRWWWAEREGERERWEVR